MRQLLIKFRVFMQLQRGMLLKYGWLKALRTGRPVDANGDPLPWITYPAIDFLSQFDFSEADVFEWGSGFSTIWWAKRCSRITTVETSATWIPYIRALLPEKVELLTPAFASDLEAAALVEHRIAQFDVIVIDNNGPFRRHCAQVAPERLSPGGMIILDNSDQCLEAAAALRKQGLTQIDFTGFIPGGGYAHTTSIFFMNSLRFGTLKDYQPERSLAQPNMPWDAC